MWGAAEKGVWVSGKDQDSLWSCDLSYSVKSVSVYSVNKTSIKQNVMK